MRTMKVIVSMVASAVLAAVCALPANAMQLRDTNADVSALRSQSVVDAESDATAMPDNPSAELPDSIASNISDDAEVVSEDHALTPDGELKNLETGEVTPTGLPNSNVLYYELTDDAWVCVRPSGTEPKVKFYYGVKGTSLADADEKSDAMGKVVLEMVDSMK